MRRLARACVGVGVAVGCLWSGLAQADPVPMLEIHDLAAHKDNGLDAFGPLNLAIRSGEIVGIAGVSGNGQRELVEVLDA